MYPLPLVSYVHFICSFPTMFLIIKKDSSTIIHSSGILILRSISERGDVIRIRVYENVDTAAVILLVMVCTCYCKFNLPSFSHPSKLAFCGVKCKKHIYLCLFREIWRERE